MRLDKLKLTNFQGIREFEVDAGGKSLDIYGDNGAGKTTVFNAVTWLLFDKPSTGAKNWSPKTRGANGEKHNLEHSATATFIRQDGSRLTLGKALHEVYKKKRGSVLAEFSGNTVDYFLDGVPVKEREYTAAVSAECGGEELMKLLTMPDYFPGAMDWKKRRALLLEICGDVTDSAVIENSRELADLPSYLRKPGTTAQYYTVEEYSKIAKARKAEINKQLDGIPGRIDEAQRAIPVVTMTENEAREAVASLSNKYTILSEEKVLLSGGQTAQAEARKQTVEVEAALASARAEFMVRSAEKTRAERDKISEIERRISAAKTSKKSSIGCAEIYKRKSDAMKADRDNLLKEYDLVRSQSWDASRETCPTCGRRLPEEKIGELRADFNLKRSERLEWINKQGQERCSKGMIEDLERKRKESVDEADAADAELDKLYAEKEALEGADGFAQVFEGTEEYTRLMNALDACREAEATAAKDVSSEIEELSGKMFSVDMELQEARKVLMQIEQANAQKKRIAELEDQETRLAEEYEDVERGVYLCEQFIKEKIGMLTEKINGKFSSVSFQLFNEQVNGGVAECCEVLIPAKDGAMVPYATANSAAKVNAGLEIIATIARHYKRDMPIFVDNAESVTHLAHVDGQVIRLVVSEEDKMLRVVRWNRQTLEVD